MPPLPSATNVVKARLVGTNQATTWNNILFLQYVGTAPASTDLTTAGNSIMAAWATNIAPLVNISAALDRVELVDLTAPTAAEGNSSSAAVVGTRAGTPMPGNVAMVCSWRANLRYRGGHPRQYMPAGVEADVTGGKNWDPSAAAFLTQANAAVKAYRTALNAITTGTTTYKLVLLSYFTQHALRPQPLPITIFDAVVHGRVDTQRRRLGRETT